MEFQMNFTNIFKNNLETAAYEKYTFDNACDGSIMLSQLHEMCKI